MKFASATSWVLDGQEVKGKYLGEHEFNGVVINSRVKYGGKVQYTVKLQQPIVVYGEERNQILMDHTEIELV
jgi:hypothetical protein